ncbi:MAG: nicotinamide-nucleotide amidohydrolase family protein [Pirellulaceae bacterium]|nr:nicotinamide-nucleotide amidohydrolase family protein [Pirellulaceae bacterium]
MNITFEYCDGPSVAAKHLAEQLEIKNLQISLAESCTGGLVAALMTQIQGISQRLCGSAVTYQESIKQNWLEIDTELITRHSAVSPQVTQAMAAAVLGKTPDADLAAAITGYLDPPVPDLRLDYDSESNVNGGQEYQSSDLGDSHCYISIALRDKLICANPDIPTPCISTIAAKGFSLTAQNRCARQFEAAEKTLLLISELLTTGEPRHQPLAKDDAIGSVPFKPENARSSIQIPGVCKTCQVNEGRN